MSVATIYTAIPPTSSFYLRLQSSSSLRIIAAYLLNYGSSIYNFFDEIDPDEVDEILSYFTEYALEEYPSVFSSDLTSRFWLLLQNSELS
jgi:hypothetical protein